MTTIAIKDNKVASDSQMTSGYTISSLEVEKVVDINGCIVSGAGSFAQIVKFRQWFMEHSDALIAQQDNPNVHIPLPEDLQGGDFLGLVLYPDGELYLYEGRTDVAYEVEQPFSIGSGSDFAIAAMKSGSSAEEAVKIATELDVFSGGEVKVFELEEPPQELTKEYLESLSKEEIIEELFGEDLDSDDSDTINLKEVDNISTLKDLADQLGIKYAHNIGIGKLRSRIAECIENED